MGQNLKAGRNQFGENGFVHCGNILVVEVPGKN
jgi:hypothetical protein